METAKQILGLDGDVERGLAYEQFDYYVWGLQQLDKAEVITGVKAWTVTIVCKDEYDAQELQKLADYIFPGTPLKVEIMTHWWESCG